MGGCCPWRPGFTHGWLAAVRTAHLLPLAVGVHALATMTVTLSIVRMTTISGHSPPQLAAALVEEGVSSPEEYFSGLLDEFRAEPERSVSEVLWPGSEVLSGSEVLWPGFDERTVPASLDPAAAGAEQSSAMTLTADESVPRGGGAPDFVLWTTAHVSDRGPRALHRGPVAGFCALTAFAFQR